MKGKFILLFVSSLLVLIFFIGMDSYLDNERGMPMILGTVAFTIWVSLFFFIVTISNDEADEAASMFRCTLSYLADEECPNE
jgi:hypothetical protein